MNGKDEWEKKEDGDKKGEGEEVRPADPVLGPYLAWPRINRGGGDVR